MSKTTGALAERKAFDPDLPAVRRAIDSLERALGGRQSLIDALATAPPDPDRDYLLGLIADPSTDGLPLSTLCARGNVTPGQLLAFYKSAKIALAQIQAIHAVAEGLPAVATDVVRRAQNHFKLCPACRSTGRVWEPVLDAKGKPTGDRQQVPCPACEGSGEILTEASFDHQKLTLDLAGLLPKGSGPSIAVGVNVATTPTPALPFVTLQQAVQQVLHPSRSPAAPHPAPILDVTPRSPADPDPPEMPDQEEE